MWAGSTKDISCSTFNIWKCKTESTFDMSFIPNKENDLQLNEQIFRILTHKAYHQFDSNYKFF